MVVIRVSIACCWAMVFATDVALSPLFEPGISDTKLVELLLLRL